MFKKTNLINQDEQVEVMALFGFEMVPCQPLSFRRTDGTEIEVDELLKTTIQFVGANTLHIFDVIAEGRKFKLEFNSTDLAWRLLLV